MRLFGNEKKKSLCLINASAGLNLSHHTCHTITFKFFLKIYVLVSLLVASFRSQRNRDVGVAPCEWVSVRWIHLM